MSDSRAPAESPEVQERLRTLPSVEELAAVSGIEPHSLAVTAARHQIEEMRMRIVAGEDVRGDPRQMADVVAERAARLRGGSLRRVINATGVVLHTNLGRAPLAFEAAETAGWIGSGYSNLELELETGRRGSRHAHVEALLRDLMGSEAAIAVNNNAAAVLLALAASAIGREVVVSRGQLVEIGGSFRIPEILEQSGARLVEVGTTNRTRRSDYEAAIGPDTAAILRVHQSNFRTVGFTEDVPLTELCTLARERGVLLIDDLGSGAVEPIGDEPPLGASVRAGADLVCCSADKLLGGPQAGILSGKAGAVERCRRHPLARAVRLDKLQLAALEATLRLHRDRGAEAIPALRMLATNEQELQVRAKRMVELIGGEAEVRRSTSRPGGGSLPLVELEGPVCAVQTTDPDRMVERLRHSDPPVIARISDARVLLDPRTMSDRDAEEAAAAVSGAIA